MRTAATMREKKGNKMIGDIIEKHQLWGDHNPLRLFRQSNNITLNRLSGLLRVTPTTIANWESGATMPSEANFAKLRRLMENPTLETQWNEWLDEQPEY